ncbi:MAG TPA: hypothetical protein VEB68_03055 [Croceibacterium sp.]|nr:hypothetical protein [Croceibacterium sp.]
MSASSTILMHGTPVNVLFYAVGVFLILLVKLTVNNRDDLGVDRWKRYFEVPADMTMLAFMMGIAGLARLSEHTMWTSLAVLVLMGAALISTAIYKEMCSSITDLGGDVQFDSVGKTVAWWLLNTAIALSSLVASYSYLGANA